MPAPTIFLIGFMGSGKTTVGKKLAAKLKYRFIDLDEEAAKKYQVSSIKYLIEEKGMDFFRDAESEALKELPLDKVVVSTGGGAPCYFDNLEWMKRRGVVVFLNVDEKSIFNRLKDTARDERPLLKGLDDAGLREFIHDKLAERLPYYNQAHITFNPVSEDIGELVAALNER